MRVRPDAPAIRGLISCVLTVALLAGCSRFKPKPAVQYVYVSAKQGVLRDRVAAVSNHTGVVTNGQRLVVLETGRRFLKVQTEKGEVGWIEMHGVIQQDVVDQFAGLKKQYANAPVISTAVLRDELYLHLKPGRTTEKFLLLPEGEKLQLLQRTSVSKDAPAQAKPVSAKSLAASAAAAKSKADGGKTPAAPVTAAQPPPVASAKPAAAAAAAAPVVLEDWWLVRDSHGDVGWMLSRKLDVDAPGDIGGYSEGQKMVGAYVLTTIDDPGSDKPNGQVPLYVAVMNSYQDGLPYDFDQIRVFTWSRAHHRYETAYREKDLQGYFPVTIGKQVFYPGSGGARPGVEGVTQPTFSFKVAEGDSVAVDPETGLTRPGQLVDRTYRLDTTIVKRVLPPGTVAAPAVKSAAAKKAAVEKKKMAAKKKRR